MKDPYYIVRVYWPKEGSYGGASRSFATVEEAQACVEEDKRLHYGCKHNPIHVIKVTPDEIVQIVDDQPEPEPPTKKRKTALTRKVSP